MVKQGNIIKLNFDPQSGREQAGYRMAIVCPITNTKRSFPLHIPLDNRTITTGYVLCEHIKSLDLSERECTVIEQLPDDLLDKIITTVFSEMDKPKQK